MKKLYKITCILGLLLGLIPGLAFCQQIDNRNGGKVNAGAPTNVTLPYVTGVGQDTKTLTTTNGTWAGSTSLFYQWVRNTTSVVGATGQNYTLSTADLGQLIYSKVTATNSQGSASATNLLPLFGIYKTTLGGAQSTIISSSTSQEQNHANPSPDGNWLAYTTYYACSGSPPICNENNGALNTEVRLINLSTGTDIAAVPHNASFQNAWPNWWPDSLSFVYTTTNSGSGKQAVWRYTLSSNTIVPFYEPTDISVTSATVSSLGNLVLAGTTTGGMPQQNIYVYSGTTRTQLTFPVLPVIAGNVLGDSAPSWSHDHTKVACLRQSTPGIFNIVIIAVGSGPGFANNGETIVYPIGSAKASWGIPQWSSDDTKIVSYLTDVENIAVNGLYQMTSTGTSITQISTPAEFIPSLVNFTPGGGSTSSAPLIYSARNQPVFSAQPVNTVLPIISGTPQVGQTLSTTNGTWTSDYTLTYSYQWFNEGTAITGAKSQTYALQASDMGALITVQVTAKNVGNAVPVVSATYGPVLGTTVRYVSITDGLDTNDGTTPTPGAPHGPWQTIAKISSPNTVSVGTTVLFKRGDRWDRSAGPTVNNLMNLVSVGTAGNPIVYDAYGTGANPIIDGSADASVVGTSWQLTGTANVWQSVQTFPPTQPFTPIYSGTNGNPLLITWTPSQTPGNGVAVIFSSTGTLPTGLSSTTTYYVVNQSGNTFNIALTAGGTLINAGASLGTGTQSSGYNGSLFFHSNDVGNILWGFSPLGGTAPAAVNTASFGQMVGAGVGGVWYLSGENQTTLSTNHTAGQWNFNTDTWRAQIYSTSDPATAFPGIRLVLDGGCFSISGAATYTILQNLTCQYIGAASSGLIFASNSIVRDDVIQWVGGGNIGGGSGSASRAGDALNPEGTYSNITIERNYIYEVYDNDLSPQASSTGPHDNTVIRNNIFHQFGAIFGDGIRPPGASTENGLNIYNNTGYGVASWSANQRPNGFPIVDAIALHYNNNLTTTNFSIENNAVGALVNFVGLFQNPPLLPLATISPIVWDYNSWVTSPGPSTMGDTGAGGNINMTSWQSTYGFETHGLIDTAQGFTNPGVDFTPTGGSALRNAGANLYYSGVVWDFNHLPRPLNGPFTVGAIQ